MDDDDEVIVGVTLPLGDPSSRPRSFSCVLLDPRSDNDFDDDDDDTGNDVANIIDNFNIDKSKEIFNDDEFKRILELQNEERSEEEKELLLESMKHMTAFNNTSQSVKEELCSVMRFISFERCDWLILEDGEELKDWYLIVNGSIKVISADGSIKIFGVGQSFGICTNKDVTLQDGQVRTNDVDCQFVCVLKDDFHAIFDKFEQNKINVEDDGKLVLLLERKSTQDGKDRYIVIWGSKDKLISQLLDGNMVDPTYIEDFLLTHRVFIDDPHEVTDALVRSFTDKSSREKVARVLLLWVNNHFEDFHGNHRMLDFVDNFKGLLKHHKMFGHLKMLDIAHSTHSYPRSLTFSRPDKSGDLPFSLVGGLERGIKDIFVSKVDKTSKLHVAGLRRGDQVLELNNRMCSGLPMKEITRVIKASTHLSIKVKSNFYGFEEACLRRDCQKSKTFDSCRSSSSSSSSGRKFCVDDDDDDADDNSSFISSESDGSKGTPKKKLSNFCRAILNIGKQQDSTESPASDLISKFRRKQSLAMPSRFNNRMSSSSDPDLSELGSSHSLHNLSSLAAFSQLGEGGMMKPPDAVLKVFKSDHTFKHVPIHKETTCKEVVAMATKEFGLVDPHTLCEVTFGPNNLTRTRTLADHFVDLFARIPVNARYYLKSHTSPTFSFPDEIINGVVKESSFTLLEISPVEMAIQLTLRAFRLLKGVRPSDHICDFFDKHAANNSKENVEKFSHLSNEEFFWVITEVCSETNLMKRMKILKHFIRIAELCRMAQNYNSMFAIIGGLSHGSVARLKNTWEKLAPKSVRTFEELQEYMDPSRNMSKYRNLLSSKDPDTPVVPFYPIFKKDMTFIHLGNDTKVNDGLINFEKMRMLAKEVRNLNKLTKGTYMTTLDVFKPFKDLVNNATEGWRKKGIQLLPKKLHEEGFQSKRAQTYLESLKVVYNEVELDRLSQINETSTRFLTLKKNMPQSSSASNILSSDDSRDVLEESNSTKKGSSQPFINRVSISRKSKLKPIIKKGSSLSSASSSSSSSKKQDSDDKSLSVTPSERWSSSSDNQSNDIHIDLLPNLIIQRPGELVNIPPPVTLPIPLQQQLGHLAVRPISHPPSKSQLAKKFPNFKPLPNSHQPYLHDDHSGSSSASVPRSRLYLEPIYSPNSGGEENSDDHESKASRQVRLGSVFVRGKRSLSSDRILERGGADEFL